MQYQDRNWLGSLLILASTLAFSSAGFFTRLITLDVWTVLFWRGLFAGATIAAFFLWRERGRSLVTIRAIGWTGLVAALCSTVATICFINALRLSTVAEVNIIFAAAPFAAAGLTWLWTGERTRAVTLAASAAALLGVVLMFDGAMPGGRLAGNLLAVAMMTLMAGMMVIIRRRREVSMLPASCLSTLLCSLVVLPFAEPMAPSGREFVYLALFGVTQFGLGQLLMTLGARLISAPRAALISATEVPVACLWVWPTFGEVPAPIVFLGGGIVLGAVLLDLLADQPWVRSFSNGIVSLANRSTCSWRRS
jgi:drug/metabolite transporter (DMT)-like permease